MKVSINDIPVNVVGPGSQPQQEQQLRYIDMPADMQRYHAPQIPEPETVTHLVAAREAMAWLRQALADYRCGGEPLLADLTMLDRESRELVNQILGEGEVSVACTGSVRARTQEAVLAGVWRTLYLDEEERVVCDLLEVADAPLVISAAERDRRPIDVSEPADKSGVLNALPILVELESSSAAFERDGTPHSINLSLLPLSETEQAFIDHRLGRGAVDILSRAYGKCQVISTLAPNVWWVRYFNSMGTPILNSLEVVDVPVVVKAAAEDLQDSASRLDEILEPYWSDVGP